MAAPVTGERGAGPRGDQGFDPMLAGDRVALSRAISEVENDRPGARRVLGLIRPRLGRAHVIGVTGAPGIGKSSLVAACIGEFRVRGRRVAVVAVDPSSPLTGGAILGDRIRMSRFGDDPEVFIRSLASRGHPGGLSRTTSRVVDVLDAAGFDIVIVETVGAGQSEVEIMDVATTVVVVTAPGLGDEIQAVKAGILEIADILVVNKADRPGAGATARQIAGAPGPGADGKPPVPVLMTVATENRGIGDLVDALEAARDAGETGPGGDAVCRRATGLLAAAAAAVARRCVEDAPEESVGRWREALLAGELGYDEAATGALRELLGNDPAEGDDGKP